MESKEKLEMAKKIVGNWIEANEERIESALKGKNFNRAAYLDSYNSGMEQAMILIEQAFSTTP